MTEHKYGPNGHILEAFIQHLEKMTKEDWEAAWYGAWYGALYVAREAALAAAWEIQGADLLRERGQPFVFLRMFGFADEQAVITQQGSI